MNRKIGVILAAAAAYGAYRYSKMNPDQKVQIKQKGKDFLNKNLGDLTNLFGKKRSPVSENSF